MRKQNTKNKKNTATISLPKPARKKSAALKAKPKTKVKTKTTAKSKAKSSTKNAKVSRKRNSSVAVSTTKAVRKPARAITRQKSKKVETVQYHVKPAEKLIFVVALILLIGFACVYVATRVQTRTIRFDIAELKETQIKEMKTREQLTEKIATYKRPELIMKRAESRGMEKAKNNQIEWVE